MSETPQGHGADVDADVDMKVVIVGFGTETVNARLVMRACSAERRDVVRTNRARSCEPSMKRARAFCATMGSLHACWTMIVRRPLPASPPSIGGAELDACFKTSRTPAIDSGTAGLPLPSSSTISSSASSPPSGIAETALLPRRRTTGTRTTSVPLGPYRRSTAADRPTPHSRAGSNTSPDSLFALSNPASSPINSLPAAPRRCLRWGCFCGPRAHRTTHGIPARAVRSPFGPTSPPISRS